MRVSQKVVLSSVQIEILEKISKQRTSSIREVERSRILLAIGSGRTTKEIAKEQSTYPRKIQRLRKRWLKYEDILKAQELKDKAKGTHRELEKLLREVLEDEERSGCPAKFTSEEFCSILSVSLEDPRKSDRPITEWTLVELKSEVEKRGIVSSISRGYLGRFLKEYRSKAT